MPKKEHLMRLLHEIKYMWNIIGEQLQVHYCDIKSAEYNVAYDNTTKLSEVLQVWIDRRMCEVSWRMIITVVKEPPVEHKNVAENIFHFLRRPEIRSEYLSSCQPGKIKYIYIYIYLTIVSTSLYRSIDFHFLFSSSSSTKTYWDKRYNYIAIMLNKRYINNVYCNQMPNINSHAFEMMIRILLSSSNLKMKVCIIHVPNLQIHHILVRRYNK